MMKLVTLNTGTALSAIAAVSLFGATQAQAQTQPTPTPTAAPDQSEEDIVVSGIRASLEAAADVKRDADQVVDVITAEDVGTLPDANVAEALQRVTGVQITRVFGEGQAVNIRGLQQVRVEVDGRTLLGWSARVSPPENDNLGRSSGLDAVPSSLFGRLEVRKSPLASQAEGGLGGTVNLVTPRPFDYRNTTTLFRVTGTYSDAADVIEPSVTGLFTTTFADDRIGILIAGEYQKRTSSLQLFERNNWFNVLNGGTTTVLAPRLLQFENTDIDRSRFGLNGSIQFRATPELTITADGLYSRQEANRTNQFIAYNVPSTAASLVNQIIRNPVIEDGYIVAGEVLNGNVRTGSQLREDPTTSYLVGLNATYDNEQLRIELDGYYTRATLRQDIQVVTLQSAGTITGRYDFRNGVIPDLTLLTAAGLPFDPTLTANFPLPRTDRLTYRANELPGNLEEWTGRADISWESDGGITLATGVRYTDLYADFTSFRSRANGTYAELSPYINLGIPGFLDRIPGNIPRAFLTGTPDRDFIRDRVLNGTNAEPPAAGDPLARNSQRDFVFNEQTWSGYAMVNAEGELFGLRARANAGLRVTHTSLQVDTLSQVGTGPLTPVTDTNSYTRLLPSANIVFYVTDEFLVRLSGSQTLQRAGVQDLAPSTFIDATNRTQTSGNAQLTPPMSTNLDLSFEYYTGGSSLISGAVFYKDVSDFIVTSTTQAIVPGFESLGLVRIIQPGNVASAQVRGFEVGVTQFFDFLPAPFDGLGVIANYTFVDSEDSNGFPLAATSRHSYNLVALFEKGPVSARVAYNWRDDSVFEFTQGRPDVIAARSQLDAQIGFEVARGFTLTLQGQNLIPRDSATVEISNFNPNAINSYALSERRYTLGLRARF
jgi:iron complex outermembrane recepter protein